MTGISWAVLFAVLGSTADIWTTAAGIDAGKRESNPLMRWLIERIGVGAALWVNAALSFALIGWFSLYPVVGIPGCLIFGGGRWLVAYLNYQRIG